eukprot:SAG31_NODE_1211_length_9376_cov_2.931767_9_plen_257_part_00
MIGGRWKILHHVLQQSAFADVCSSCGVDMVSTGAGEYGKGGIAGSTANGSAMCYVRNDRPIAFIGSVSIEVIHLSTGNLTMLTNMPVSLPAGGGAVGFFCAANSTVLQYGKPDSCPTFGEIYEYASCANGAADCMLNVIVHDNPGGTPVSRSVLPLTKPSNLRLNAATNVSYEVETTSPGSSSVSINLYSNATAIYVWLSTQEQGRFSDNAFILMPGDRKTIKFMSFLKTGTSSSALKSSLRVEHLAMYMPSSASM